MSGDGPAAQDEYNAAGQQSPTRRVCLSEQTDRSVKAMLSLFTGAFPPPGAAQHRGTPLLSPFTEEDTLTQRGAGPGGGWHLLPFSPQGPSGFEITPLHLQQHKSIYLPDMFCKYDTSSFKIA